MKESGQRKGKIMSSEGRKVKILAVKLSLKYRKEKIFFSYSLPKATFFLILLKRQNVNISGASHLAVMQRFSRSGTLL